MTKKQKTTKEKAIEEDPELTEDEQQLLVKIKEQLKNKRRTTMQFAHNNRESFKSYKNNEIINKYRR